MNLTYFDLLDIANIESPYSKVHGINQLLSFYYDRSDNKQNWREIKLEFMKDAGIALPYPVYGDRVVFTNFKKYVVHKVLQKNQKVELKETYKNLTARF